MFYTEKFWMLLSAYKLILNFLLLRVKNTKLRTQFNWIEY
jgi:hypothetical protein